MENNPFLLEKLKQIFIPKELEDHLSPEYIKSITVNNNKIKRSSLIKYLQKRNIDITEHTWNKLGAFINNNNNNNSVPIGATPEYLAGLYFLQASSSIIPVLMLTTNILNTSDNNIKKIKKTNNLKILDMCASPGGKTVLLSTFFKDSIIHANDFNKLRINSLKGNIMRYNLNNTFITTFDGRKMSKEIFGLYDRILLDAPCSGSGTLHKDTHAMKLEEKELKNFVVLQKELILNAFDLLKQGGFMVYSTCSVFVDENEWVVDYLLKNRKTAKVEKEGIHNEVEFGKSGIVNFRGWHFHESLKYTKRFNRKDGGDGFYVAKIKKH